MWHNRLKNKTKQTGDVTNINSVDASLITERHAYGATNLHKSLILSHHFTCAATIKRNLILFKSHCARFTSVFKDILMHVYASALSTAAYWVKKSGRGKKVAILWQELQISDRTPRDRQVSVRGNYGCLKFPFFPWISPKWWISLSAPNFAVLDDNFRTRKFSNNFPTTKKLK